MARRELVTAGIYDFLSSTGKMRLCFKRAEKGKIQEVCFMQEWTKQHDKAMLFLLVFCLFVCFFCFVFLVFFQDYSFVNLPVIEIF